MHQHPLHLVDPLSGAAPLLFSCFGKICSCCTRGACRSHRPVQVNYSAPHRPAEWLVGKNRLLWRRKQRRIARRHTHAGDATGSSSLRWRSGAINRPVPGAEYGTRGAGCPGHSSIDWSANWATSSLGPPECTWRQWAGATSNLKVVHRGAGVCADWSPPRYQTGTLGDCPMLCKGRQTHQHGCDRRFKGIRIQSGHRRGRLKFLPNKRRDVSTPHNAYAEGICLLRL